MPIYTRTGDKGETGIIGKRLSKDSPVIHLIGSIDELNASLGIVLAYSMGDCDYLLKVQSTLFAIGAILAGGKVEIDLDKKVLALERQIDRMDKELKPLKNFIIPGGGIISSHVHLSRTICRRAERNVVKYITSNIDERQELLDILKYINRLSDYLFTLARYLNQIDRVNEVYWKSK